MSSDATLATDLGHFLYGRLLQKRTPPLLGTCHTTPITGDGGVSPGPGK